MLFIHDFAIKLEIIANKWFIFSDTLSSISLLMYPNEIQISNCVSISTTEDLEISKNLFLSIADFLAEPSAKFEETETEALRN